MGSLELLVYENCFITILASLCFAVYGLSESSPLTHCDGGRPGKLGTIGQLVPSTVAKVRNQTSDTI